MKAELEFRQGNAIEITVDVLDAGADVLEGISEARLALFSSAGTPAGEAVLLKALSVDGPSTLRGALSSADTGAVAPGRYFSAVLLDYASGAHRQLPDSGPAPLCRVYPQLVAP